MTSRRTSRSPTRGSASAGSRCSTGTSQRRASTRRPTIVSRSSFEPPGITELDLAAESISTVMWTTGYRLDYGWIDLPAFDADGIPRQVDGVSEVEGLSFIGLPWLRDQGSATLFGIKGDAERLLARLEGPPALG